MCLEQMLCSQGILAECCLPLAMHHMPMFLSITQTGEKESKGVCGGLNSQEDRQSPKQ